MLSERDLLDAIRDREEKESITSKQCVELAALYILLDKLYPISEHGDYSFADSPVENTISVDGNSDFLSAVNGKSAPQIWGVLDELMATLQAINPRLYEGVMRKINA